MGYSVHFSIVITSGPSVPQVTKQSETSDTELPFPFPPPRRAFVFMHHFPTSADTVSDPTCWKWFHCLDFPVDELRRLDFSPRPYKWIRYSTCIVVGVEDHLSRLQDTFDCFNYNSDALPESLVDLYYHMDEEEKIRIFPLDPDLLDV